MTLALIALLAITLLIIIVIDLREQIIPNMLNVVVAGLGIAAITQQHQIDGASYIYSAIALGGIGALLAGPYSTWRGRDMLGWGDVKFLAAAGLWLPFPTIGYFLFIAGVAGALASVIYKARTGRTETPFAPALCTSLLLVVLYVNGLLPQFFGSIS